MGPNGAGKSTLLNIISGVYKPNSGTIRFKKHRITGLAPHKICHLGIARTYQIPQPFTNLTALQNIVVAAEYGRGLGKAAEIAQRDFTKRYDHFLTLRDRLQQGILSRIPHVQVNGHPTKRLPNTLNASVMFIEGESLLLNLDLEGIAVSSGSACTSGSLDPSHVLLAMGIPCEACRGFWDHPNEEAIEEILVSKGGLPADRAKEKSRMFTATMRRDAQ
jgi:ABC-type sugar transport system ATPase subunit